MEILKYFSQKNFMPHGHCYLWKDGLVISHVLSDGVIGLSYFIISILLYWLIKKIEIPFTFIFLCFGVFIAACGATHFVEIWNLWNADYWFAAAVKVFTAIASILTAFYLFKIRFLIIEFSKAAKNTELQRLELIKVNHQLSQQTQILENMYNELEAFSYSVSHDLRTPLRCIDGFSAALEEEFFNSLDPKAQEYLGYIKANTKKMERVISDLIDLSRSGKIDLKYVDINLSEVVKEVFDLLIADRQTKNVKLDIAEDLHVQGDLGLIKIALENLLSNSIKFTVRSQNPKIEFGQKNIDGLDVFYVKDNGDGFDVKSSNRLFEAFQRFHAEHDFPGTGIGLTIVKRIILRHKGSIWAESEVGKGASFYFNLG